MTNSKDNLPEAKETNSATEKFNVIIDEPVEKYGSVIAKNLGFIIKAISFVVAFAIIIITFIAAFLVFSTKPAYIALSLGIVILGTVTAAITMFIIYGLGHLIIQNNEILKKLK